MLAELWYDLKAAVRSLLRKPAFVAVAALTLAMGVGATTVAFSLVNQVLLRPLLGVRNPDEAAYLQIAPLGTASVSYPDFELLRENASLVDGMAYYGLTSVNVTLDQARPVEVQGNLVAGDFFEVLGVSPLLGRLLVHADGDLAGDPFVAVISERLWATLFDRAPDVVGKRLKVGDHTLLVIGVAGGEFAGPERGWSADLWIPRSGMWLLMGSTPDELMSRESTGVSDLLVRPRPGATPTAIEGQLDAILARAAQSFPESAENLSVVRAELFPGLHSPPRGRLRTYRSISLLAGVVGLVLLIACANVANLLLFRGVTRRGEVATRRALGASTSRLVRQHVAESLIIAVVGTTFGLAVGWVIGLPFRGFPLFYSAAFEGVAFDVRVFLFGAATVLLTTLLFGAVPAILAGRADPAAALAEAGTRETGRGSVLRSGMAAIQLALSMSLLVTALLLVRTLGKLYATDTGLAYEQVATTYLEVDDIPVDERDVVMHEIVEAVKAVPGVQAAALADRPPFTYTTFGRIRRPEGLDSVRNAAIAYTVTPEWFDVLGVQAVSGSTLSAGDWQPGAPSRVIFSEGLARRLFGAENMLGQTISAGFGRTVEESEISGVIPDLGLSGPGDDRTEFFVHSPFNASVSRVAVLARTTELNADVLSGITAAVERAVPQVPVPDAVPLRKYIDGRLAQQRLFARMIGLVAALSVLLAAVGLYGVVAFTVAGRRREMGIRLALGADGRSLANLVARYALGVVGLGVALGVMGASWLENLLGRWLFDLAPLDPVSYGASILMFVVVAVLACWVPTRSAMRVDPAVTLRAD